MLNSGFLAQPVRKSVQTVVLSNDRKSHKVEFEPLFGLGRGSAQSCSAYNAGVADSCRWQSCLGISVDRTIKD